MKNKNLSELQVSFYYRLKTIKDVYLHEALSKTISTLDIPTVDSEIKSYVDNLYLQKLALYGLRAELIYPLPYVLTANPFLLGYYRLLFGVSQKEFYTSSSFGAFKGMEEKGSLSKMAESKLPELCRQLAELASYLVEQIDSFSLQVINDLQILTVGPQLRGSKNNDYGKLATQKTFDFIKSLVQSYIVNSTPNSIEIKNDSGRIVVIKFASDPDIVIIETQASSERGLISIEIKGGLDYSNIHNRIGEAEKSHQKAKKAGYFQFMTILRVDIDYDILRTESPTTNHFFHLDRITDTTVNNSEALEFKDILSSTLGITIKNL